MPTLKPIGVLGSGVMGRGIAQVLASTGNDVILCNIHKTTPMQAKNKLLVTLNKLQEKQKLTRDDVDKILQKIYFTSDIHNFKQCDLVIETIAEDLHLKQEIFSKLDSHVNIKCILGSCTSSLSITAIASACISPQRVLGIHFFNPPSAISLVEIIPTIATDNEILNQVISRVKGWGKLPIIAKDTPGFIVNRIARPYYCESLRIYEEGIADFATIDWALKQMGKFKMGPFELMDFIGNDINYMATKLIWRQLYYEPRFKPSITQKKLFEVKWFGRKTERGFYDYHHEVKKPEPKQDEKLAHIIFNRVIALLIAEAIHCLYLQLATKEDIDLAMTKGVNYPHGLLRWADDIGLENILATLNSLHATYQEERYRSPVLLQTMVQQNKKFYP